MAPVEIRLAPAVAAAGAPEAQDPELAHLAPGSRLDEALAYAAAQSALPVSA